MNDQAARQLLKILYDDMAQRKRTQLKTLKTTGGRGKHKEIYARTRTHGSLLQLMNDNSQYTRTGRRKSPEKGYETVRTYFRAHVSPATEQPRKENAQTHTNTRACILARTQSHTNTWYTTV